jgi:putative polymerase
MMSARSPAFPWPSAPLRAGGSAAPAAEPWRLAYLGALIVLTLGYQLGLCYLHTRFGLGGNRVVVTAELAMVVACLPLLTRRLPLGFYLALALLLANGLALALLRQALDPKLLRDLMVPLLFLGVGLACGSEAGADRILRWAVVVVLAVALFEFCFLDVFTRYFDVYSYYLARGVGDPAMAEYRADKLVASGIRPEGIGRTLLPILGAHRASSVFIEPVSFGNFAVIVAAWGLAKEREQWRQGLFFVAAAMAMVVLSDSRFGLGAIGLMVLVRVVLVRGAESLAILFPLLAVGVLVAAGLSNEAAYSDSYLGRLARTGQTLLDMHLSEILGVAPVNRPYHDMGYPYVLSRNGLAAVLALWAAWWLMKVQQPAGQRFRILAALYVTLILCVSGSSFFAFKTSALLGFLLGCGAAGKAETDGGQP